MEGSPTSQSDILEGADNPNKESTDNAAYDDPPDSLSDEAVLKKMLDRLEAANRFKQEGNLDEAISLYRACIRSQKTLNLQQDIASTYYCLGDAFEDKQRFEAAIEAYLDSFRIQRKVEGKPRMFQIGLFNAGRVIQKNAGDHGKKAP